MLNLWEEKGVPYRGWECVTVTDVGEYAGSSDEIKYEQCEMCGNERIRYVHVMKHNDYPKELRVGCVCAEKMSGDYVNPRKAEAAIRNKVLRRESFMKRPWRYNPRKGTYSKKYKGMYITLVKGSFGSWGVYFLDHKVWQLGNKHISSFAEAELVAFELFDACYKMMSSHKSEKAS